jgi:hypothetical protein
MNSARLAAIKSFCRFLIEESHICNYTNRFVQLTVWLDLEWQKKRRYIKQATALIICGYQTNARKM